MERIGGGGMGEVYRAEQRTLIRREVAVKLIKLGMDTRLVIARFEAERQALALMDHPHIAKVFDAGADDTGRPYFVMEYVRGQPITEFCDARRLTIPERLDLFSQVCSAVQHAHQKGIIHRDLKPGNVLASEQDGIPSAKVIDFGIAKALSQPLTEKTLFTRQGDLVGTPLYMSPEQAAGSPDIDTRSDVYSLGVMLYELLTGSTPFTTDDLRALVLEQFRKLVAEVEPPTPSSRLSRSTATLPSLAAARRVPPSRLGLAVRGELDWIVMKSLEKDRYHRYSSPIELAADLLAHLRGEPVKAAPPSAVYRFRKFVRKRRGPLAVAAVVACAVTIAAVAEYRRQGLAVVAARTEVNRLRAEAAEREAAVSKYIGMVGRLAREESQRSPGWAERSFALLDLVRGLDVSVRDSADLRSLAAEVLAADEFKSNPDWTFEDRVWSVAYDRSGDTLAVCPNSDNRSNRPRIELLNPATGRVKQTLEVPDNPTTLTDILASPVMARRSRFESCAFADSDRTLIAGMRKGRLYRWDLTQQPPSSKFVSVGSGAVGFALTSNDRLCVAFSQESEDLRCFETATLSAVGKPYRMPHPITFVKTVLNDESANVGTAHETQWVSLSDWVQRDPISVADFHPAGQFYLAFPDGKARTVGWPVREYRHSYDDPVGGRANIVPGQALPGRQFTHWAFSGDGRFLGLLSHTQDGEELWIYDSLGGQPRWRIPTPPGTPLAGLNRFAIAHDGGSVALTTEQKTFQYSRLHSRLVVSRVAGHDAGCRYVRLAPDRSEFAAVGEPRADGTGTLVIHRAGSRPGTIQPELETAIGAFPPADRGLTDATDLLSYSPDGVWVVTAGVRSPHAVTLHLVNRIDPKRNTEIKLADEMQALLKPYLHAGSLAGFGWSSRGELVAAVDYKLFAWDIEGTAPKLAARTNGNG